MLATHSKDENPSTADERQDKSQVVSLFIDKLLTVLNSDILSAEAAEELYGFGYALYQQGQLSEATETFLYLVLYSKTQAKNYVALGACCQVQEDFDKAALLYQFSIELGNKEPAVHFYLGECFLRLNRKPEALEQFMLTTQLTCNFEKHNDLFKKSMGFVELIQNSVSHNSMNGNPHLQ
jgi:tetratricopeptide (TPR) repeat protein